MMDALMKFGGVFSPTNVSEKSDSTASMWLTWFQRRFLPTYLTYLGSVAKASGKVQVSLATPEPKVAATVAPLVAASKGPDGASVWDMKDSPWKGFELNSHAGSVDVILAFLKEKAKAKPLSDGVGSAKKPVDGGKGWTDLLADKSKSALDTMKSWGKSALDRVGTLGKELGTGVKNMATSAASAVANSSVGKAVGHAASQAASAVANSAVGKAVTGVSQGVGDSMKSFGSSLGKAYKAVTGNAAQVKNAALAALKTAGITNPTEIAMFMAQMDTESGGFKSLSENLKYSASTLMKLFGKKLTGGMAQAQQIASQGAQAVANFIYGNRMGNTGADDGFKYRGRGIVQLTGKDNYAKYGKMLGLDLVGNPDLAADPKVAAQIAVAYWKTRVPSAAAQAGNVAAVTKAINGGENGLASRQQNFQKYLQQAKTGQLVPNGASSDDKKQQQQASANTTGVAAPGAKSSADASSSASGAATGASTGAAGSAVASAGSSSGAAASPAKAGGVAGTLPTGGPNAIVAAASAPAASPLSQPAPSVASIGTPTPVASSTVSSNSSAATSVASAAPAAPSSAPPAQSGIGANPFGFGLNSAKSTTPPAKSIMAVQQAQHEDKMSAMGNMGDVMNKALEVQTDSRDLLKTILSAVQAMQKGGGTASDAASTQTTAQSNTAGGNAGAARRPQSSLRGQQQQMPTPPVSMMNAV
jgi:predicted chitinase